MTDIDRKFQETGSMQNIATDSDDDRKQPASYDELLDASQGKNDHSQVRSNQNQSGANSQLDGQRHDQRHDQLHDQRQGQSPDQIQDQNQDGRQNDSSDIGFAPHDQKLDDKLKAIDLGPAND